MEQPTICYEGIDIPDFGERHYPYGVLEVTRKCNLRCKTCFFFQALQHDEGDLPDEVLIAKLRALQRRHNIKSMSLVGGEPCLRPKVLEAASDIFPMNVVFTNGTQPIPDLPMAFGVSLDGPPAINDAIRGKGIYDRAMATIAKAGRPLFIQSVVSTRNFPYLDEFTAGLKANKNLRGVTFSIYVPQIGDTSDLWFGLAERDRVIEKLLDLKDRYGDFILNSRRALELACSATCKEITDNCDMKENSLALDYGLRRRLPCCYGENVNCDLCAAPTPFNMAAKREARLAKDGESGEKAHRAESLFDFGGE